MNQKSGITYHLILNSLIVLCLAIVSYAWFDIKSAVYFYTFKDPEMERRHADS